MTDNAVDYVVVGAGTAGCVLAARLAVDPDVQRRPAGVRRHGHQSGDLDDRIMTVDVQPVGPAGCGGLGLHGRCRSRASAAAPVDIARGQRARRLQRRQRDDLHPRQPP